MTGGFAGRSDNRLENLELWTKRHPGGHRVEDVARYCREMLAVYGDDGERVAYEPLMPVEQRGALMAKGYDPEVAQPETGPADGDEAAA